MNFDFYLPTRIVFGRGKLKTLHEMEMPGKKAFIVMSKGNSVKKNGTFETLINQLRMMDVEYVEYNKIQPNPTNTDVDAGAKLLRDEGCDFVIGLGGGSAMDSSKAIAIMATNPGEYWDYIQGGTGGKKPIKIDPLPVVAITTTAGTGTESDPWMVITNEQSSEKMGLGNKKTFPCLSIVDSELMRTVPKTLTAYQGFDALFHSMEGYIAKCVNGMSDLFAGESIRLIGKSLVAAVNDGDNMDARDDVALANTMAGVVEFMSGCTSEHALEHAMSAYFPELPHGAGLLMISYEYFKCIINLHVCDERFVQMAKWLGMEDAVKPEDFLDVLTKMQKECGVYRLKMSDYGIKEDQIPELLNKARQTMATPFGRERVALTDEMCLNILKYSYR